MKFAVVLCCALCFAFNNAYDIFDPNGNITIKWDVIAWEADGYTAIVTLHNFQKYRHIEGPGWKLGWAWAKNEVIWDMKGGETTEQGDCSSFKGPIPHSCERNPRVVDLLPGIPYNQQVANCCKGGVLASWAQDPPNAKSSFQLRMGQAGTNNRTVSLPKKFTLQAPGPGYTCSQAKIVRPSKFPTPDNRRFTQALMTWEVTCTYSQFLAQRTPTCCVSLSSFYSKTIVDCTKCSCGCTNVTQPNSCIDSNSYNTTPLVQCTSHMCPVRVHWHVKLNYKQYWRVKVTIQNFNYGRNYSHWNLVVQHPNLANLTQVFSFNYEPLTYGSINDTSLLWGLSSYNDMLVQNGNVQTELLFYKDRKTFTFHDGWAFPRTIYFNGDTCVMPPPDHYPSLPNQGPSSSPISLHLLLIIVAFFIFLA